jgi:hypothetical protein
MKRSHPRSRRSIAAFLGLAVATALTVSTSVDAAAPPPVHGQVVPDTPVRNWPRITDGSVNGGDRVAQYIVYGGSFTTVTQPDGTVSNQPYLVALDIDTGKMSTTFRPVLDGQVRVVEAGDTPGTVFVGGRFKNVNGVFTGGLVKLDVMTGQAVGGFSAPFNGEVSTLARAGNRLFVGGFFTAIGGAARSQLAEISASNGAVNANFTIGVTGLRDSGCRADGFCYTVTGPPVRSIRVNAAGTRLAVMHRGDLVGGQQRWGAAIIDISTATPSVTSFKTDLWDPARNNGRTDFVGVIDGDMTPDGSMIVMANGIGNFPPLHDTVTAFPVNGGNAVQPLWVNQNFDSNFSVAVSDQAVYQGGHFCWVESQASTASPLYWPGSAGNQYSCEATSGSVFQPRTTYRYHVSAGDLSSGRAIAWDPGSNDSFRGVNLLRTIDRGLLLGHDGTRVKNFNVGRSALFDMGIAKEPRELAAPTVSITNPVANQTLSIQTVLGSAGDDYRVKKVQLRMRDRTTNQWIQPDGTRGATAFIWDATLGIEGLPGSARAWSVSSLPSPVGSIEIQARSADFASRKSAWVSVNVTGDLAGRGPIPAPVAQPIAAPEPPAAPAPVPDPGPQQSRWRWEGYGAAGIAQAPDGTVLRVDLDGGVSRRTDSRAWEKVPAFGTGWTGAIAAVSGADAVGAINGGSRRRGPGGDIQLAASAAKSISIGADGTIGYVDAAGALTFVENGTARTDGSAVSVAVQSNGVYWKVGTDGALLRGRPGAWTSAGSGVAAVSVSAKGEVAIVTADGKIARYIADGNFEVIDGLPTVAVSVSSQRGKLFALGADKNVYRLGEIVKSPADL